MAKTGTPTVPVLDKGNYNNKKTLCDFIEQEEIARKMIKEAQEFYDSFLMSKTVTFKDIIKYPNIPLISYGIKFWYTKVRFVEDSYIDKLENTEILRGDIVPDRRDTAEILITLDCDIDFGGVRFGYIDEALRDIVSEYHEYIHPYSSESEKWRKKYFKNPALCEALYEKWEHIKDELKYEVVPIYDKEKHEWIERGKERIIGKITIGKLKELGVIPPADKATLDVDLDYGTYKQKDVFFSPFRYSTRGEKYAKIGYKDEYIENWDKVVSSKKVVDFKKRWDNNERNKKYHYSLEFGISHINPISVDEAYDKVDFVKEYIDKITEKYNPIIKSCFQEIVDNLSKDYSMNVHKLYDTLFLLTRDGKSIELLTNQIQHTEIDKKTGIYKVECKHLRESHAKWRWPSDGPVIVTNYYQTFYFDIATNDLVNYSFYSHSDEIQYNRNRY